VNRRLLALALCVGLPLVAAGCGGGTQSKPQKLGANDVPFGLLDAPTSTVPPTTVPLRQYPFVVYFINGDGAVNAVVRTSNDRPIPSIVGDALLAGPTPEEIQVRMHTAIPKRSVGHVSGVLKQTVKVDLDPSFGDVNLSTQRAALAQIVYTLTALRGVKRVRFLLNGWITSVPRGNGTTRGTVTRADYAPAR
jgi:spore germination protein GerM